MAPTSMLPPWFRHIVEEEPPIQLPLYIEAPRLTPLPKPPVEDKDDVERGVVVIEL